MSLLSFRASSLSRRIPIPLPNPLINHIKIFRLRIPSIKQHTLPPARKPIVQIETQVPCSLVESRGRALRGCFARENFCADWKRDGRVCVAGVRVREGATAGGGVAGVIGGIIGLGVGCGDGWAGICGSGGGDC